MFCIGNFLLQIIALVGFVKACPVGLTDSCKTLYIYKAVCSSLFIYLSIYLSIYIKRSFLTSCAFSRREQHHRILSYAEHSHWGYERRAWRQHTCRGHLYRKSRWRYSHVHFRWPNVTRAKSGQHDRSVPTSSDPDSAPEELPLCGRYQKRAGQRHDDGELYCM